MAPALVSRIKVMADMNIVERRRPQDGQIETTVDGKALDIRRRAPRPTVFGEKSVLRLLDKSQRAVPALGDLGMPADTAARYREARRARRTAWSCARARPARGKTTTLYATLDRDQRRRDQRR